ncbi:MAG: nucleotidyltransferase domain-containing protein [Deltaproteobacteria bacterium]|nr:nucleotidyltransferase domain-containing protein [Deltaproteobacteria bacterium]
MFPLAIKVFLFGSFAAGNYTPESDIDIMIIGKKMNAPFLERRDLFIDFFKEIPFDINLMVYTQEEVSRMKAAGNLFVHHVMETAREL